MSLPAQLTRFVGRDDEVAEVRRLLVATRLLTLTGAGGSGKTRLALEVLARSAADLEGGVAWAELAPLSDPEHLGSHVAAALGVRHEGSGAVEEALVAALRERAILLALDNCEHLVDACARLAELLLRRCPRLRILATSREALGIAGERSWLVPVLALPDPAHAVTAADAMRAAAVQLFVLRARDALPAFALTDANAAAVARICRRVDGLPLAIELAAARVRVLSPEQIAVRLDEGFRVLGAGPRTALPRHRTLREAIDWSYRLLDEREQRLLDRLSAFAGDFSLEAAEAVCADDATEPREVLEHLGALVDKSLVAMRELGETARYHLLETIRQHAAERLDASGEAEARRTRHAHHYEGLVAAVEADLVTPRRPAAVERLRPELDNLRAALRWTREHDPAMHLRLAGRLTWLWYSVGLWAEGRRWLEGALALAPSAAATRDRAAALFGAGAFASLQAHPAVAREWLAESLHLARAVGDERLAAYAANYLGMAYVQLGQAEGEAHIRAALDWFRPAGDLFGHRLALLLIATLRLFQADLDGATQAAEEGVAVARAYGMDRELGISLQILSEVVQRRGDLDRADALTRESLRALLRDPQPLFIGRALDLLGVIACRRGDPVAGARFFGAAAAEREVIGADVWRLDRERLSPHLEAARAAAGPGAFVAAWEEGARRRAALLDDEPLDTPPVAPPQPVAAAAAPPPAKAEVALRVRALGPLEVYRDGIPMSGDAWRAPRPRELFVFLMCHPEGRTRDQIGLAFWPEASAAQVKNNFHVTLHHIRKALGGTDWVVFEGDRYRINAALGVDLDAATFETEARAALAALRADATGPARERLERALARYRGDFLEHEGAGDWHLEIRDRLRRLWVDGALALGALLERGAAHGEAAQAYRHVLAREPLHEEACRRLMTCLSRAGDRGGAMRAYDGLATRLRTDLATEPDPRTAALHDRIRRGERLPGRDGDG